MEASEAEAEAVRGGKSGCLFDIFFRTSACGLRPAHTPSSNECPIGSTKRETNRQALRYFLLPDTVRRRMS